MKLTFLGAAREVTGSCTLLEACGKKILIDCGLEQGADTYENQPLHMAANDIDCVIVTHAHIDHSGNVPKLFAEGYSGPVYTTAATKKLCEIMLMDSAHIQESNAEWKNRKAKRAGKPLVEPPYTTEDAQTAVQHFNAHDYGETFEIFEGITLRFWDAGHLLGSASAQLTVTEGAETRTLLFSGDLGNISRPLIRDPQKPDHADIVVVESTYGDRLHGARGDYAAQLTEVIQSTLDKGGNVVIPAFAVGRTQELLYLIRQIKAEGRIKGHGDFPVYVDSPLAIQATTIFSPDLMAYYDDEMLKLVQEGINPLQFEGVTFSVTSEESKLINEDPTPKVIISASGMCEAGRIRHHLKYNLWRKESTVLFVGYQSPGTIGRLLMDGVDSVKILGDRIKNNARIANMDGISGHADRDMLLGWLQGLQNTPSMVFVNHGEDESAASFAQLVGEKLGCSATAPYNGACYDLLTLECLDEGNKDRIHKAEKADANEGGAASVFEKLRKAGNRLMTLIEGFKGRTDKQTESFTRDINDLCSRWD